MLDKHNINILKMENKEELIIYGLRDPRTDEYKYVGKSICGMSRAKSHLISSHNKNLGDWIKELKKIGEAPFVDVFEVCEKKEDLRFKEKFWVSECLKNGNKLYNILLLNSVDIVNKTMLDTQKRIDAEIKYKELLNILPTLEKFGETIKNKRLSIGMTQQELADKVNVARSTIVALEQGENPTLSTILLAIKALNING